MPLKFRLACGLLGAVAIILVALAFRSSGDAPARPPLSGWMKNFTPLDAPAPAPQVAFRDRDSKSLGLGDFRGKVVLVNFWATWCGPCIREMPTLAALQKKLGGDDFRVIALSEDRKGWKVITPFLEKAGLGDLPAYHDAGGRAARALKVKGLPTTILFNREGREVGRLNGIAEWDSREAVALMRFYMAPRI